MKRIPSIIGVLILVLGIAAGIFGVQSARTLRLGAAPEATPSDVRVTNITNNSFTVSWTTDKKVVGFVNWGASQSLGTSATPADSSQKNVHSVTIAQLKTGTVHFFKINSGGTEYDNAGIPWQVTTAPDIATTPGFQLISGSVMNTAGQPVSGAVIYITSGGLSPLSAITSANGSWIAPVGSARNSSLSAFFDTTNPNSVFDIFVQAGPAGFASAKVTLSGGNPMPAMTLGQTYDFRNETTSNGTELPETSVEIPDASTTTQTSKFKLTEASASPQPTTTVVTLDSVKEGETLTTVTPEFFGKAPDGTSITITVESEDPVTQTITADDGEWSFAIPTGLAPGNHKITIKWKDASGILRTIVRNFTVSAAEEDPSFESTPSATIKPSPTPKATPRVSIPATDTPVPVSGSLTPTLILLMLSIGLLATSCYLYAR